MHIILIGGSNPWGWTRSSGIYVAIRGHQRIFWTAYNKKRTVRDQNTQRVSTFHIVSCYAFVNKTPHRRKARASAYLTTAKLGPCANSVPAAFEIFIKTEKMTWKPNRLHPTLAEPHQRWFRDWFAGLWVKRNSGCVEKSSTKQLNPSEMNADLFDDYCFKSWKTESAERNKIQHMA